MLSEAGLILHRMAEESAKGSDFYKLTTQQTNTEFLHFFSIACIGLPRHYAPVSRPGPALPPDDFGRFQGGYMTKNSWLRLTVLFLFGALTPSIFAQQVTTEMIGPLSGSLTITYPNSPHLPRFRATGTTTLTY